MGPNTNTKKESVAKKEFLPKNETMPKKQTVSKKHGPSNEDATAKQETTSKKPTTPQKDACVRFKLSYAELLRLADQMAAGKVVRAPKAVTEKSGAGTGAPKTKSVVGRGQTKAQNTAHEPSVRGPSGLKVTSRGQGDRGTGATKPSDRDRGRDTDTDRATHSTHGQTRSARITGRGSRSRDAHHSTEKSSKQATNRTAFSGGFTRIRNDEPIKTTNSSKR
ncbi:hypothetical protein SARC_15477 [Sphaeroforma arctica JP610]|uniref:Uncharacterized protein n=1 Tax=Sphaeroforma arctica JP610 TaxID=667725 RepID=A0A0L0F5R7_9EUKA|nr:hypothetical protein SARC_15477 [Sphaeroforma arctica JP610]KNC71974.1 hypothetical protein SARC_15477 [Sphaeroforma arctica JP610]|eukprot:XP_014145876.1 hypothetical protein SARC_15477 [Sphaeroforma arctica JP610]